MEEGLPQKLKQIAKSCLTPGKLLFGVLVLSFLLSFLFNVYIFQSGEPLNVSLSGWFASSAITAGVLLLSVKWKWFGFIFLPLVALVTCVVVYIHAVFGSYVTYEIVASICETHWGEAAHYCTWDKILGICLLIGTIVVLVWYGNKKLAKSISWKTFALPVLIYAISSPIFSSCVREDFETTSPTSYYFKEASKWPVGDFEANFRRFRKYKRIGGVYLQRLASLPSMADADSSCSLDPEEEITVVLHIGESERADHLQLNGYGRETNPCLMKRVDQLVSFKDCHSFGLVTRDSVIGILTDAEIASRTPQYSAVISLFNRYAFDTARVIYCPPSIHDLPMTVLTRASNHTVFVSAESANKEEPLLAETIRQFKQMDSQMSGKRKFILVYDKGCHWFFSSRAIHKKFLPDSLPGDAPLSYLTEANNAYDNNLVEVDWEIDELLKHLEKKNAVYIHVGDHGVALGEDGHFLQGNFAEPVRKPPFFIWMSDSFREKHKDKFVALQQNARKFVSHDYVLHTLLSLSGLHFSGYKPELDLTNPEAKPFDNPPTSAEMMQN
jgi:glucan phosphoethanolaminetransferase (alkaline phosphatase superfamily)